MKIATVYRTVQVDDAEKGFFWIKDSILNESIQKTIGKPRFGKYGSARMNIKQFWE